VVSQSAMSPSLKFDRMLISKGETLHCLCRLSKPRPLSLYGNKQWRWKCVSHRAEKRDINVCVFPTHLLKKDVVTVGLCPLLMVSPWPQLRSESINCECCILLTHGSSLPLKTWCMRIIRHEVGSAITGLLWTNNWIVQKVLQKGMINNYSWYPRPLLIYL